VISYKDIALQISLTVAKSLITVT